MKKPLLFLTLSTMICTNIEANRTLTINYTGNKIVGFTPSLPGIKNIFNEDIFDKDSMKILDPKKPFSANNVTNNSFVLRFAMGRFSYTVPAGKDGDTICLEVNDTSVKECNQPAAKK